LFLKSKDETIYGFVRFLKKVKNKNGFSIINIRSDHGGEFISDLFEAFCEEKGYHHHFSHLELPNKIGLWEGKIDLFKKWQE